MGWEWLEEENVSIVLKKNQKRGMRYTQWNKNVELATKTL